jgi:hypothetical protein
MLVCPIIGNSPNLEVTQLRKYQWENSPGNLPSVCVLGVQFRIYNECLFLLMSK